MPTTLAELARTIEPAKTILLFGAGSSMPSGAPSVQDLIASLSNRFQINQSDYTLGELAGIIENRTKDRRALIACLRERFEKLKPTGALLNVPLYEWKSIFTTNYDHLIEDAYKRVSKGISPCSSNFDFTGDEVPGNIKLFKLHGTIEKDISDGNASRIIITAADYDLTNEYRQHLFDRLKSDLAGAQLVVIGHSLADPDIRDIVNRAAALNMQALGPGKISLLLYSPDPDRATLFESRGIQVCFGGIDDFFSALAKAGPSHKLVYSDSGDPFDHVPGLRPITVDVAASSSPAASNVAAMFNGWPATHADIADGLTFDRTIASTIVGDLHEKEMQFATIVGASGTGKTTAARQVLHRLQTVGLCSWSTKLITAWSPLGG